MANRRFWLGMLVTVTVLVFGMTVIGCEEEETEGTKTFFDVDITVYGIPSDLNGQNFTMSIIRDDIVKTSENGVVADGEATAKLKITNMAPKSEITSDFAGREIWVAYIAIEIGSNPQLVKEEEFLKLPDDTKTYGYDLALVNGGAMVRYSDFE
jgi:hypothetical protein